MAHTKSGIAVGLNRGFVVSKPEVDTRSQKPSKRRGTKGARVATIRDVVREICGFSPFERRMLELLRAGDTAKDKKALKVAKSRLGTLRRAKRKRAELETVISAQKKAAAQAANAE
jgi:large subunit ribosomal protein L36e